MTFKTFISARCNYRMTCMHHKKRGFRFAEGPVFLYVLHSHPDPRTIC